MTYIVIALLACPQDEGVPRPREEDLRTADLFESFLSRFQIGAELWIPFSSGTSHAHEFQSPEHGGRTLLSSELDFGKDLGIGSGIAMDYHLGFSISSRDRIEAHVLIDRSGWDTMLERDIVYNETFYAAGTEMHSELHHFRLSLAYERDLITLFEDSIPTTLTVRAGWSWDRISLKLDGEGVHKGEDLADEVIPFAGITVRAEVTPWLSFSIRADVGLPFLELTSVSANTLWYQIEAGVEIRPWKGCTISAGYFFGGVRSEFKGIEFDRDGADNAIDLDQHGFMFSIDLRF